MSSKILEALKKLDPANEAHWTSDGLPRLDVLDQLTGEKISREILTQVAKGFTRKSPVIVGMEESPPTPAAQVELLDPQTAAGDVDNQKTLVPRIESLEEAAKVQANPESFEETEESLQKKIDEAQKGVEKAQTVLSKTQAEMDLFQSRKEAGSNAGVSHAETVKLYQEAQARQREQAVKRQQRMDNYLNGPEETK